MPIVLAHIYHSAVAEAAVARIGVATRQPELRRPGSAALQAELHKPIQCGRLKSMSTKAAMDGCFSMPFRNTM
jgi:hypothetical protein